MKISVGFFRKTYEVIFQCITSSFLISPMYLEMTAYDYYYNISIFPKVSLTYYTWRRFVVVKVRISKIREMPFYLTFGFLGFKVVKK